MNLFVLGPVIVISTGRFSTTARFESSVTKNDMDGILKEFEKLEKKQINKPLISSVDNITQLLEETKQRIQNGNNFS